MVDPRSKSAPATAAAPVDQGSKACDASLGDTSALDRVLSLVDERATDSSGAVAREIPDTQVPAGRASSQPGIALRAGFVQSRRGMTAEVSVLGADGAEWVEIAPHVDGGLVDRAMTERSLVLLGEWNAQAHIIGLIQTRLPDQTLITGKNIVVEASEQLTLRSGRAAIALRSDGALEMVGTRIAATSRGVFRLIGRALRLN